MRHLTLFLLLILSFVNSAISADRPNILWITAEDYSASWLGCYGNKQALTPNIDALADRSVLFTAAFSNGPVCAVARSTILTGAYAPTIGSQHMRSRHRIPKIYQPYVTYLRKFGYYCTNHKKTDYNIAMRDGSIWDNGSRDALSFAKLPKDQPFFTVVNLGETHESSLFAKKIRANRKRGVIPKKTRLSTEQVIIPPYLPSIPGIRHDIAVYHDNMTALDSHVGKILADLKKNGLADNTIIFHYSDHGGVLPRGKRYLTDTGTRISMIVYFPKKWQHLSPFQPGERVDEPVSFVDLAPTLLSLLGEKKPEQMLGRAFLGPQRVAPAKDEVEFLYADRFDEIYGMRRGITDGRWKYIRRFTPHLPAAPYS
jgi:arylsulfatase A-like enzyme